GRSKRVKRSAAMIAYAKGTVYGLTEYYGPNNSAPNGCKVWIYSRQSKRELADTFFHEMVHVFFQMIGGVNKQGQPEEAVAKWIGYLAKITLADYDKEYGRNFYRKRIY
ncbi:MAG: hypothetical protein AAB815_02950, partial [Patescibacteria group bacterium]